MRKAERTELKERILQICRSSLTSRIVASEKAMADAQEAANSEEKSSAGDKYETGRAMAQRERDMVARQLAEARKELNLLNSIKTDQELKLVGPGAVIQSGEQLYFIGAALGKLSDKDLEFIAISPGSPLGQKLKGLKQGASLQFNQNKIVIEELF